MEKFRNGIYVKCITYEDNNIYKIIYTYPTTSEYHARFDIINMETDVIGEGVYLYNGYWKPLTTQEMREFKLKRILK